MADNEAAEQQLRSTEGRMEVIANTSKGMTSEQAAALLLSGGVTDDPDMAQKLDAMPTLDFDAMQRAALRRMMGFDFQVKHTHRKIHVYSKEGPRVSTHCKIKDGEIDDNGILQESVVDRLVDACLRLKNKWDKEVANADAN